MKIGLRSSVAYDRNHARPRVRGLACCARQQSKWENYWSTLTCLDVPYSEGKAREEHVGSWSSDEDPLYDRDHIDPRRSHVSKATFDFHGTIVSSAQQLSRPMNWSHAPSIECEHSSHDLPQPHQMANAAMEGLAKCAKFDVCRPAKSLAKPAQEAR